MAAEIRNESTEIVKRNGEMNVAARDDTVAGRLRIYENIIENNWDGICFADLSGRILYANRSAQKLYGYTEEELREMHIDDFTTPGDEHGGEIMAALRRLGGWTGEVMHTRKDRSVFHVLNTVSMVFDGRGHPIGLIFNSKDVTERVRAEEECTRKTRELLEVQERFVRELEEQVAERTKQLNTSLAELRALKEQQDGDYYLTSLLLEPLGGNHTKSDTIRIETALRQKKQFKFRKWEAEIGGDMLAVHDIQLRGEKYTVFLNGDAMGKSMQGAGGALVMGTVFKSMVARTRTVKAARNRSPEQWLKECFLELHSVFTSFDGHMLVSAVIGLVRDEDGMCWYLNAEHPTNVLFREGRAGFVEEPGQVVCKIGIEGAEEKIRIQALRLNPGDVLFVGSDGRDDLHIATDEEGNRIINEDETLFPRLVEKGGGDLDETLNAIQEAGGQTDDISLLRITYDGPSPTSVREGLKLKEKSGTPEVKREARRAFARDDLERAAVLLSALRTHDLEAEPDLLWMLGSAEKRLGRYGIAADLRERYCALRPEDTEALFHCAVAAKKAGRYQAAVDFGERCRLRAPENARNLVNLADAYRKLGDSHRVRVLLDQAARLDPNLPAVRRLTEMLESA